MQGVEHDRATDDDTAGHHGSPKAAALGGLDPTPDLRAGQAP
jgi:hypothetical protein